MKKLLVAFVFMLPVTLFAQLDAIGTFNRYVMESWAGQYQRVGNYKVKGSPFLFAESMSGEMKLQGDVLAKVDKILYDLNSQKVGQDVKGEILESDKAVEEFTLHFPKQYGGETASFRNGSKYGNTKGLAYYNVLAEGKNVHFLKMYKVKTTPDPSNMMDKEARIFEQFVEYYIYDVKKASLTKVKLNKKDIASALKASPELKDKIDGFGLAVATESDAIGLTNVLNL